MEALPMKKKSAERVKKVLDWFLDRGLEDRQVTVGCKHCKESKDLLASTARTAWLMFHDQAPHEPWIRNPFVRVPR